MYWYTMSSQSGNEGPGEFVGCGECVRVQSHTTSNQCGYEREGFANFQSPSNGEREFLRNRRSNRHIVPLYGKCDGLFTQGRNVDRHLRYPGKLRRQALPWPRLETADILRG